MSRAIPSLWAWIFTAFLGWTGVEELFSIATHCFQLTTKPFDCADRHLESGDFVAIEIKHAHDIVWVQWAAVKNRLRCS